MAEKKVRGPFTNSLLWIADLQLRFLRDAILIHKVNSHPPAGIGCQHPPERVKIEFLIVDVDHEFAMFIVFDVAPQNAAPWSPLIGIRGVFDLWFANGDLDDLVLKLSGELIARVDHVVECFENRRVAHAGGPRAKPKMDTRNRRVGKFYNGTARLSGDMNFIDRGSAWLLQTPGQMSAEARAASRAPHRRQETRSQMLSKDRLGRPWPQSKTVDPEEIARFTALAEEWRNPNGKFRPIHRFNPVRRDYIVDRIIRHFGRDGRDEAGFTGLKILDVGCGAGLLCEPLAERGAQVVGIDATARNIEIARWHAAQKGLDVDYRHCLAEHVLEMGERYDVVLNTEVVEHVTDPKQLMKDCSDLVKPDGVLVVATLNRTLRSFLLAIIGAEYLLRWLPKGTHDWRRFQRPEEVRDMIERHGLKTREVTGVTFNPIANRWRLSSDSSVNYMLLAVKGT